MEHKKFEQIQASALQFFTAAESGSFDSYLEMSNLTPDIRNVQHAFLKQLGNDRQEVEQLKDIAQVATRETKEALKEVRRLLLPINSIAKRHFRSSAYKSGFKLNRRYKSYKAAFPESVQEEAVSLRKLVPRSMAASAELARLKTLGHTLQNMSEEMNLFFAARGVTAAKIEEFVQKVADFETAYFNKPLRQLEYAARLRAWHEDFALFYGWWTESIQLMRTHLGAQKVPDAKSICAALGMG